MRLTPKYSVLNLCFCLVLLGFVGWSLWDEFDRPWKEYQRAFNRMDTDLTQTELKKLKEEPDSEAARKKIKVLNRRRKIIAGRPIKIQQLWLTDFGVTDRCITCHPGVEMPRFAEAPEPYRTHPGRHIDPQRHPVDKYGCVICHDGQGMALEVAPAHGEVAHWLQPLLSKHYAEASCTTCHPMQGNVPAGSLLKDAPVYSKGRGLYLTNHCRGCHTLNGFPRPERIGPVLTKIATKTGAAWLHYWIKKPKNYLPETKMPDFELEDEEIKDISSYLVSLKAPLKSNSEVRALLKDPRAIKNGRQAVANLGCLGCHSIKGKGESFGPELSRVGEKASPDWMFDWIKDPKKYWPKTAMPKLRTTDEETLTLVAYLSSLRGPEPIDPKTAGKAGDPVQTERGRKLAIEKGCTGCHEIAKFPLGFNAPEHNGVGDKREEELIFAKTNIPHTLLAWLQTKVKTPRAFAVPEEDIKTLMPVFGFEDKQVEALSTFLLSLRDRPMLSKYVKLLNDPDAALTRGELLVERFNCRGCHRIGEKGGTIGPDLGFEGNRIKPQWLVDFLQGPFKIRPEGILPTRMPTFGLTPRQAQTVAAYFAHRNQVTYPYDRPVLKVSSKKDRDKGWWLYGQFFACHTCHSWKGQGGVVGPDQSVLAGRLRKDWITAWLKNPQKYIPDVRMPNFELYDDELVLLSNLLMSFEDIPPSVWDQMRRRWQDELLEQKARKFESSSTQSRRQPRS